MFNFIYLPVLKSIHLRSNNSSGHSLLGMEDNWNFFAFILIIAVLAVLGWFLYTNYYIKYDVEINETTAEITINDTYIMKLKSQTFQDQDIDTAYMLKDDVGVIQQGYLRKGYVEYFSNAKYNKSYYFYADNSEYYFGYSYCYNNQNCTVKLDKQGNLTFAGAGLTNSSIFIIAKVEGGVIKNPIICVDYTSNIYDLSLSSLNKVTKPQRITSVYNTCFNVGSTLNLGEYYYTAQFQNSEPWGGGNFSFILIDEGYDENYSPSYEFDNEAPDKSFDIQI